MRGKWMVAPWMRRRIARHLHRGTSDRLITCLIGPVATPPVQTPMEAGPLDWQTGPFDRTNVIPFRGLKGDYVQPASAANRRPLPAPLIESN